MADWKNLFTPGLLERAQELIESGAVTNFEERDSFTAMRIRDEVQYGVTLWHRKGSPVITQMDCTCDDSHAGRICVHMAAGMLMLAGDHPELSADEQSILKTKSGVSLRYSLGFLQEEQEKERQKRKQLEEEEDYIAYNPGEYRYFQTDNFLSACTVTKEIQLAGEKILSQKKAEISNVSFGYITGEEDKGYSGIICVQSVKKVYYGAPEWGASVVFSQNRLEHISCTLWNCRTGALSNGRFTLCPHTYAAVKLLLHYLETNREQGDATSVGGMQMLNTYGGMHLETGLEEQAEVLTKDLRIVPYLNFKDDHKLYASFGIGKERIYKIKSISKVMEAFRTRSEYEFGKSAKFRLDPANVGDESLPWYHFLEDAIADNEELRERLDKLMSRSYYYQPRQVPDLGQEITLGGEILDHFFDIAEGKRYDASYPGQATSKKSSMGFVVRDLTPELEIHKIVNPETGAFEGILMEGEFPHFVEGREASYYIDGDCLCRIGRERSKQLKPLMDQRKNGKISIRIGRNHLSGFYRKTLPGIKQIANVTEYDTEELARYIPPKPEFVVYLDVEGDFIVMRADACYGSNVYFATDLLEEERTGKQIQSFRDREAERELLNLIIQYINQYDASEKVFVQHRDDEAVFALLDHGLSEMMRIAEVRMTERFQRLRLKRRVNFTLGISVESNLMDLEITSDELSPEELLDILFSYHRKRKFVRLKNGDFLKLDDNETIAELARMMEDLHISPKEFVRGKMHLPAYRALYLDRMLEKTEDIYTHRDQHFKALIKEFRTVEDADFEVPGPLIPILRRYQQVGYRWLRTLDHYGFGGILADEMGLGKTLQVIAVILAVRDEALSGDTVTADAVEAAEVPRLPEPAAPVPKKRGRPRKNPVAAAEVQPQVPAVTETRPAVRALRARDYGPSLIICPASLVYNWGEEISRFAPTLRVGLLGGTQKERKAMIASWLSYDVLVTSYDILKRDIDAYEGKRFRFCIIDEAQYIKNNTTAAAKSVKLIDASARFALTGTPIENRLSELWSIFDFLMPGFLYDYETFRSELESRIVKGTDDEAKERLSRMVSPFILRRKKMDVLTDLPDKLEEVRYAQMEKKQQNLYDAQVVRMRKKLTEQSEADYRRSKIEILSELTRIRQICCDPGMVFEDYDGASAKTDLCVQLIESLIEGEHKALVFSQFTKMLAIIEEELNAKGIAYYKITGDTPKQKRLDMVNAFNGDETPVFLISLRAGGTGLNLTGADAVIHVDPWWNLAVQNQATDRAHRIGQTKVVTVYKLIMKGTIEEKILEMQELKKQLAEDILEGEGVASAAISREDLLNLLSEDFAG